MKILGISAFYHDSAATLLVDGNIIAAAQEERFTRKKHDSNFPTNAINYCLDEHGISIDDLDAVVFYDKPLLKFERLLETYYNFAPRGIASFIRAIPVWLKEKLFLKKQIYDGLKEVGSYNKKELKLLFPEHHLSHAASAFYSSPFDKAAIVTIDGVGEWATASICKGDGNSIKVLKEMRFPHSLGLLYSAFTYFLGFKVNSGEYKLMGLAPYGNINSSRVQDFVQKIKAELIEIKSDGSLWLNQKYFSYATGLRMARDKKWEKLFGIPRRESESEFEQVHCDLGLAIQLITEEVVLKMVSHAKEITGSDNLCMAGGVVLNCVANGKIERANIFKEIFIQPAAGDAGGALGAAQAVHHIYFGKNRDALQKPDLMQGSYLGPSYNDKDVSRIINRFNAEATHFEHFNDLCDVVSKHLIDGAAIGWMQDRMEFGPRALGNRSILGDPRNPEMQKKLNLKIKYRESFRPFAPSVLAEDAKKYFTMEDDSPYMLMVHPVKHEHRLPLPDNYPELNMRDKLYHERSNIPAITHIDFSARIQTVHQETNPKYHQLIAAFKNLSGIGMVVNTSFNVRGEPIVCTPEDAYRCFMRTEMDVLVIGNYVFEKTAQPNWDKKDDWKEQFVLD